MTDTTDDTKPKRRTRKVADESVETPKPVRRTRKKTVVEATEDNPKAADDESAETDIKPTKQRKKSAKVTPKEAFLEFVELDSGVMVLREVGSEEPLVSIGFADKVKEILGVESMHDVGQHMIQAAIASVMQRQMSQYHAHVYDEKPKRYS